MSESKVTNRRDELGDGPALAAALVAARRYFDGESPNAAATERRIFDEAPVRRRNFRAVWVVPLAAAFLGSAALAAELGGGLDNLTTRLFGQPAVPAPSGDAAPAKKSAGTPEPAPPPPADVTETGSPSSPSQSQVPPTPRSNQPAQDRSSSNPAPSAPSAEVAPQAISGKSTAPDEMSLYRDAHRAHFVKRDFAEALALWDRYLELDPRGTFALEARYNRAIALYRLGRNHAAITALKPFAQGTYGRYRSDEARQLLEELGAEP